MQVLKDYHICYSLFRILIICSDIVDALKQVAAVTTAVINAVDCAIAPNCTLLGRHPCSIVLNTCGSCLAGYIGQRGHYNSPCYLDKTNGIVSTNTLRNLGLPMNQLSQIGTLCAADSDCSRWNWEVCQEGICSVHSQQCPNDCSGHGKCQFVSTFNASIALASCFIIDYDCAAVCDCDSGYSGRDCSYTAEDFALMMSLRHDIVVAIKNISMIQEKSKDNIISWLNSLSLVAADPNSIFFDTKVLMTTVVMDLLKFATSLGTPHEALASVGVILDVVLSDSKAQNLNDITPHTLLKQYGKFISRDMPVGQNPVVLVNNAFRLSSMSLNSEGNATAYTPFSAMEGLFNRRMNSVTIQPCGATEAYKLVLRESMPSESSNDQVLSNSFGLSIDSTITGSCPIVVTLQHAFPIFDGGWNTTLAEFVNVECRSNVLEKHQHVCSNGLMLNYSCNGTISGVVKQQCPVIHPTSICASIGDTFTTCTVVHATPFNVSCACVLTSRANRMRRLEDTDDSEDSKEGIANVEFVAIGENVAVEFAETWSSAGELTVRDVSHSWKVLVTVGSVGVVSIVLMALGWYADNHMHTKDSPNEGKDATDISRRSRLSKRLSSLFALLRGPKDSHLPFIRTTRSRSFHLTDEQRSVESALPKVLKPLPLWAKFKIEAQIYHRYMQDVSCALCRLC